jgi:hypothetical protein
VRQPEGFTAAVFPAITSDAHRIDALLAIGAVAFGGRRQIADFALQNRLPTIGIGRVQAQDGWLMSYGPTQREMQ